jgi:antitoxin (DNA-binding transcriptional repressor) of toxin-antitoxin stability system
VIAWFDTAELLGQGFATMPTTTVRDLRNHFARVSRWIENGENVMVTRGGKPFATLTPVGEGSLDRKWPDLSERLRRNFPKGIQGKPMGQIISEARGEQ